MRFKALLLICLALTAHAGEADPCNVDPMLTAECDGQVDDMIYRAYIVPLVTDPACKRASQRCLEFGIMQPNALAQSGREAVEKDAYCIVSLDVCGEL